MLRNLLLVAALVFAQPVLAECTFKTGEYIDDLRKPQNVKSIDIEVGKSAKYARNLFKLLVSNSRNIPPELKKKFMASVTVTYPFGTCKFNGRIRQHGDWKDHIKFLAGGKLIRSLDVKLSDGNILSAVRFKLLIPETRRSENEILATQILKRLNFISPETFAVDVAVNGISSTMLFQENAAKELLERNLRRESAILEGDEELLWSYKDFSLFELEPLSLSRLTNANWFLKGSSSETISMSAFSRLQLSYLNYADNIEQYKGLVIDPNSNDKIFDEMAFSLLAMNAEHAMRPHNRKFYFNALKNKFEPIYYDGNANFIKIPAPMRRKLDGILSVQFPNGIDEHFIATLENVLKSAELKAAFVNRARKLEIDSESYYESAIEQSLSNIRILADKIKINKNKNTPHNKTDLILKYLDKVEKFSLEQIVFLDIEKNSKGYKGTLSNGKKINLSISDVAKLISKNTYKKKRAVLLSMTAATSWEQAHQIHLSGFPSDIYTSEGIKFTVSEDTKVLHISQNNPTDWALFIGGNLANWSIQFDGKAITDKTELARDQRFNAFGITGCLTFFETELDNTSVQVLNGGCEDSLNIISSSGVLTSLEINTAFADALDMDFSNVTITNASIKNAGNDCYDVSTGTYAVVKGQFETCGDKGVSVGEGSNLYAKSLKFLDSNIGISSKDYSKITIDSAIFSNVITCVEAKQKNKNSGVPLQLSKKWTALETFKSINNLS